MGYELEMKVGSLCNLKSGKSWFIENCSIRLCKCGDSSLSKLASKNMIRKGNPVLSWFECDNEMTEDAYGDKPSPIPLVDVIKALKKDVKVLDHGDNDRPYRRFEWALGLLEAVNKTDEAKEFCVIFVGY